MNKERARFEGLLDEYFESFLAEHPIAAAHAGRRDGEGKLGRAHLRHEQSWERRRQRALAMLDSISPRSLSNEQQLDRLALRSELLRESEDFARGRSSLDPRALDALLGILLHELQRGGDEPKRAAANIRGLLRDTPDYLGESSSLVKRPERVWCRIMQQTAAGAPSLFEAVEKFLQNSGADRGDASLLREARKSLGTYASSTSAKRAAPEGSFAVGAAAVQRRVRDQLGLDYTLGEIESLALGEVERITQLLREACARFGRHARPEQIIEEARLEWNPGENLLGLYREETRRVAQAFQAAKAVTFPKGESLDVRPVPDFMRHLFPTAAYSSPGAFEKRQRGIFWVNDLSVTKSTESEKRAERQQHFGLSLTCAHEAYPGHHLQFVTANRHPRKWRRLFAHAVFYEGWTLWCEQLMVDLKIDRSSWLRVQQLHDALWRAHRILVDLRLQTGRYSYENAVKHMQKHLGFTSARAEADVNWYTGSPTVPMSYWLGRLENERLRQRLVEGRGWSLQKFNDWLLSFGTLPQAWIEKYGLD
ncbi:MAG TPA: DUF885 domain-containing protein [Methylomirabilota bacterium]|nr:DUF885 domain-containing protein [Methylomirabilota bacterium]